MIHRPRFAIASIISMIALAASADFRAHLDSPLDTFASFDGKPITLERFVGVLSESGCKVKYPAHLANRRLSIASRSHSVKAVLDMLCDLEGWTWRATDDRSVTIEEVPAVVRPQETIYAAVRRTLPPDLASFLRMAPPDETAVGSSGAGALSDRMTFVAQQTHTALLARAETLENSSISLSRLSSVQKDLVSLAILFSPGFQRASGELLSNSTWLFARPEATRLSLQHGTILMVECDMGPGRQVGAFGANLAADP